MSEMQLRMATESGEPEGMPELQEKTEIRKERSVKLCRKGHEKTPETVDSNNSCKICAKLSRLERYRRNAKKINEQKQQWRKENPDRVEAYKLKHKPSREQIKINAEKYKTQRSVYIKKWRKEHRSNIKQHRNTCIQNLTNAYIASKMEMRVREVLPEVFELKRLMIKIHRATKCASKGEHK